MSPVCLTHFEVLMRLQIELKILWLSFMHWFMYLKLKKNLLVSSIGEDVEELELSYTAVENVEWYKHHGKYFWQFLKTLSICWPNDSVSLLVGLYLSRRNKSLCLYKYLNKNVLGTLTETLFVVAKSTNNSGSSTSKWINQLWSICTKEYYPAVSKDRPNEQYG